MKKNSLIEYTAYLLVRLIGIVIISLPSRVKFWLGKSAGILGYSLLKKKRNLALKNLKIAFSGKFEERELEEIAKKAFISLALNIIELLYIPKIGSRYINKHIRIENLKCLDEALARGKGVILLAYHLGNWELANITCGLQGYTYRVIVNEQKYPILNNLLNRYRESKGCKTIPRGASLREVLKALKNNEVVAMVGDQGGKEGKLANLFGLPISTPTGFVRFALSTGASVIPAIIVRERRFYHRIMLESPLRLGDSGDRQDYWENCLAQSNKILERYVSAYPQEYFWFYKIWKYSPFRTVVALSDGKAGHLRQAQAVLKTVYSSQFTVHSKIVDVKFKNRFAKVLAQIFLSLNVNILEFCLTQESYLELKNSHADLVISCGSSVAGVNLALARENLAKSICVMGPGMAGINRFDLIVMPRHDKPPVRKNTAVTWGALNLIDEDYLREQADRLRQGIPALGPKAIGLLIGGDTKKYKLTTAIMRGIIRGIKEASGDLDADILITTSRRTPRAVEVLIKESFADFKACKLLVIANEKNIPEAVGGILGLAGLAVVSGESISMVSEAANSGKYTVVFKLKPKSYIKTRHEAFLRNLESQGYIYIFEAENIAAKIKDIFQNRPAIKKLNDRLIVEEAIKRLL